jgi:hypothetical protein
MQLACRHDERPGESYEALDGKKADSLQLGKVSFDMEDDTTCTVPVHPEVAGDTWFGRTLDLSRAYKQLALDKASRLLSLVGYFYQKRWVFFRCDVLPFGASAAVYSFNWVSLHHLICKLFWGLAHVFMMITLQSVPVHLRPFCQKQ